MRKSTDTTLLQYEQSFIGAVLVDPRIMEAMPLTCDHFYGEENRQIVREIQNAMLSGQKPDQRYLSIKLPEHRVYIESMRSATFTTANTKFYYEKILEAYQRRGLEELAMTIRDSIEESPDTVMTEVERRLGEIDNARLVGYRDPSQMLPAVVRGLEDDYRRKGALLGLPTGLPTLDGFLNGFVKERFYVLGARPGAGKTAIALNFTTALLRAGKSVGWFSCEMAAESLYRRLLADQANVEYSTMDAGTLSKKAFDSLSLTIEAMKEQKLYINDTPNIEIGAMLSDARKMKRRHKVDIIIIDYLGLVRMAGTKAARWEQVGEISRTVKQMARELKIPVVVLSQLTREAQNDKPSLHHLRDSGSVEQDADVVMFLWKQGQNGNSDTDTVKMLIPKNRWGRTGEFDLVFMPRFMKFEEPE